MMKTYESSVDWLYGFIQLFFEDKFKTKLTKTLDNTWNTFEIKTKINFFKQSWEKAIKVKQGYKTNSKYFPLFRFEIEIVDYMVRLKFLSFASEISSLRDGFEQFLRFELRNKNFPNAQDLTLDQDVVWLNVVLVEDITNIKTESELDALITELMAIIQPYSQIVDKFL